MSRLILRSFVNAQAIAGVVLTLSWLDLDSHLPSISMSLLVIAALLLVYSLIPASMTRSPDRLTGTQASDAEARDMLELLYPSKRMRRLVSFATDHKFSIQLALTSTFLLITALLLQYVASMPAT